MIEEYAYLLIPIVTVIVMVLILLGKAIRDSKRYVVRVHKAGNIVEVTRKKPEANGSTITMEKKKKGQKFGWHFNIRQIEVSGGLFKKRIVDVIYGAENSIIIDCVGKGVDAPCWDRQTEENYLNSAVIKKAGETGQKLEIPFAFWILGIATLGVCIFILMRIGGIRIG
jgi:hypothetical protein